MRTIIVKWMGVLKTGTRSLISSRRNLCLLLGLLLVFLAGMHFHHESRFQALQERLSKHDVQIVVNYSESGLLTYPRKWLNAKWPAYDACFLAPITRETARLLGMKQLLSLDSYIQSVELISCETDKFISVTDDLKHLISNYPEVKSLIFQRCGSQQSIRELAKECPRIKQIFFKDINFTTAEAPIFEEIRNFPNLTRVMVLRCSLTRSQMREISEIDQIEHLVLSGKDLTPDFLDDILTKSTLMTLWLDGVNNVDDFVYRIGNAKPLHLKTLWIRNVSSPPLKNGVVTLKCRKWFEAKHPGLLR